MYRRYKIEVYGERASVCPLNAACTTAQTRAGLDNILLPAQKSSASDADMASDGTTQDILEKIRETVDSEGHGESFVFVILGASVSLFLYYSIGC